MYTTQTAQITADDLLRFSAAIKNLPQYMRILPGDSRTEPGRLRRSISG